MSESPDITSRRIDSFADLETDWDSYGAPPITEGSREAAKLALDILDGTKVQVVPTCSGGVQIEWHNENGDLELEIMPDGETIDGLVVRRV